MIEPVLHHIGGARVASISGRRHPDYDPWSEYQWPDRSGQLERAPKKKPADPEAPEPDAAG